MIRQLYKSNKPNKLAKRLQSLLIIAVLCLVYSSSVFSLGLGGIQLKSALNQKLDADIELLSVGDLDISDISIKLASPAVYDRMGIERSSLFDQLQFEVSKTDAGDYLIHVTTPLSISEPFLNFLVEVNWASGRLIREFTVLLDPPVFLADEGAAAVSAPEIEIPSPAPALPIKTAPISVDVARQKAQTTEPEIVETTPPTAEPVIEEQVARNENVVSEEISNILAGEERSADIVTNVPEPAIDLTDEIQPTSLSYNKVKQGEFLWGIANKMRPENVSVEQMMLALKRENPNAFFGDNVSMLKAGAVLRIEDTAVLTDLSNSQAIQEIAKQNRDWLAYRKERQARNAVAAASANLTPMGDDGQLASATTPPPVVASNQPLLQLVAPVDDSKSKSQTSNAALEASEEKVNELNIELVMATEEMEARKRENEDLVVRLNSLEEQMSAMQSLVQLKDAELAKIRTGDVTAEGEAVLEVGVSDDAEVESSVTKVVSEETNAALGEKQLWQDPVTLGTIVAALLLVGLGLVLLRRKTNQNGGMSPDELEISEKTLDELLNMDADSTIRVTSIIGDDTVILDKPQPDIGGIDDIEIPNNDLGPMTEVLTEDTVYETSAMDVLDPLSEADVYITYERYDKAEELLKEAIQATPNRQELKLKLLEVYATSGDGEKFNGQVDEFYAAIQGDEFHPLWQEAIAIGHAIGSNNPLFSFENEITPKKTLSEYDESVSERESGASNNTNITNVQTIRSSTSQVDKAIPSDDWEPEKDRTALMQKAENNLPENDILDTQIGNFDSADADDAFDSSTVDKIEINSELKALFEKEAQVAGVETIPADFDGDEHNISADDSAFSRNQSTNKKQGFDSNISGIGSKISLSDDDLTNAMSSFSNDSNVESLIIENEKEADNFSNSSYRDNSESSQPISISESRAKQSNDNTFFLLSDEVGTKLDLARAYIEMGDYDGASDLLEEVISEGSKQQQNEAKKLMRKTGT